MLLAETTSPPGACLDGFSWNAATIGGGESTFAGVLAGLVFTGIVTILGFGILRRRREAAAGLKLMSCAFLGLMAAAYLLVLQSADQNCLRTISEGAIFGGILGTFVIIALVALTWLVTTSDKHEDGVLSFLRQVICVGAGLVALLLCTSSFSYLRATVPHGPSPSTVIGIYLVGSVLYVAGLPGVLRPRLLPKPLRAWILISEREEAQPVPDWWRQRMWPADFCARLALGYLVLAAAGGSIVVGTTDRAWDPPPTQVIYVIAWSSVVFPLCVLVAALRACAPDPVPDEPGSVQ